MQMHDHEEQLGFELGGQEPAPGHPNLSEIREDLAAILAEARQATSDGPWDIRSLRYKKIVFLQLVKLLPDDEGEQLGFDFLGEVERIEALLAA
jgi:DNA transposition AAA+ family ATPase